MARLARERNRARVPLTAPRDYIFGANFSGVGLIAFCLALDAYTYLTPSEIVGNPFFGFREREHRYADVQSINTRLIGKHRDQLECQILFKDGSIFSTDAPPSQLNNAEIDAFAAYVYERTTVPWTHNR